jgi:hypothetical protein
MKRLAAILIMVCGACGVTACTPAQIAAVKGTPDSTLRWECPVPDSPYLVYVNDEGRSELEAWNQAQCSPISPVVP